VKLALAWESKNRWCSYLDGCPQSLECCSGEWHVQHAFDDRVPGCSQCGPILSHIPIAALRLRDYEDAKIHWHVQTLKGPRQSACSPPDKGRPEDSPRGFSLMTPWIGSYSLTTIFSAPRIPPPITSPPSLPIITSSEFVTSNTTPR